MSSELLPPKSVQATSTPPVVNRGLWQAELDALLVREKAHTREGDAIAAARRRLPMVEVSPDATVVGAAGAIPFLDVFEGRRMLVAYFHMWHEGNDWPGQCEGCTFSAAQIQRTEYLNARDITLAVLSEGTYEESRSYADFLRYVTPWYSAQGSSFVAGRGFGFLACYVRDDDGRVFETYWTTGRGVEATLWSYALMDMTVFGRQEAWEDSPPGWPTVPVGEHPWRVNGRPTAQWAAMNRTTGQCESDD